jgi:proteinaceous RNase P
VDAAIAAQGLDLGEAEYARLLQAAAAGGPWARAEGVLRRLGAELTVLQPATLDRLRALFASPAAAAPLAGGERWEVGPTCVGPSGVCSSSGGQLRALDLSPQELAQFGEGIAAIAERQEKRPRDFQAFRAWLQQHGPHAAVIDGANVALYGQNFESGGFNFKQIRCAGGWQGGQGFAVKRG